MSKLVVVENGKVVSEWLLKEPEATVGRDSDCDLTLDDPSVSRHHAKVIGIYGGFFIEDLHSTNGVMLNGRRVSKHMLKDGDCVHIGAIELRFVDNSGTAGDADENIVTHSTVSTRGNITLPTFSEQAERAYLRFMTGPDQGNSRLVDRALYTIGESGGNLAAISRRPKGYFLMHLGGDEMTIRNGEEVHRAGVELVSGDMIQVGDIQLEFYTES